MRLTSKKNIDRAVAESNLRGRITEAVASNGQPEGFHHHPIELATAGAKVAVVAYGAYGIKDVLKAKGFKWAGTDRAWYKLSDTVEGAMSEALAIGRPVAAKRCFVGHRS